MLEEIEQEQEEQEDEEQEEEEDANERDKDEDEGEEIEARFATSWPSLVRAGWVLLRGDGGVDKRYLQPSGLQLAREKWRLGVDYFESKHELLRFVEEQKDEVYEVCEVKEPSGENVVEGEEAEAKNMSKTTGSAAVTAAVAGGEGAAL